MTNTTVHNKWLPVKRGSTVNLNDNLLKYQASLTFLFFFVLVDVNLTNDNIKHTV